MYIKKRDKFIAIAEALGWNCHVYENGNVEFQQYSSAGEDFLFTVDGGNIPKEVFRYAEEFDPDEHAEMWVESRGKRGVPSSIRTLIDDADDIQRMLDELAGSLNRTKASNADIKMETLRSRDDRLKELWGEFGDIPMDPETECMEEPFLGFPAGTHREEVWHWFDERHSKGVACLLYASGEDPEKDAARAACMRYLTQPVQECDAENCAYNPEGVCIVPYGYGREPRLGDDGCLDFCYKTSYKKSRGK